MEQKNLLELTPEDWAGMSLRVRLWNYIKLVEYIYWLEHKSVFEYEISDPEALGQIIEVIEKGREGFILLGEVGCGKTFLMKMIQKVMLPATKFRIVNTVDVVTNFKSDGEEAMAKYIGYKMFFDDLGFEQKGIHFGDKVDCVDYLTYKRYEEFSLFDPEKHEAPVLTYFASNLSIDQIKARYDQRTVDRMMGMCRAIKFKGSSKRISSVSGIILPQIFPIRFGLPKPNPPQFTIGVEKSKSMSDELRERMDQIFGVPDHENQRTVRVGTLIEKK